MHTNTYNHLYMDAWMQSNSTISNPKDWSTFLAGTCTNDHNKLRHMCMWDRDLNSCTFKYTQVHSNYYLLLHVNSLWNILLFYASRKSREKIISVQPGLNLWPCPWDLNLVIDWLTDNLSHHCWACISYIWIFARIVDCRLNKRFLAIMVTIRMV